MNGKRRAMGVAVVTAVLALVAVAIASAHHKGLYLNYDTGRQKSESGKENYAHLWWMQYDSSMYWQADSSLRAEVVNAISSWATEDSRADLDRAPV